MSQTTNSTSTTPDQAQDCVPTTAYAISAQAAAELAATLKALGDPLRLRMLSAVATDERGESCVCDLAELAEVSQPTVSHHLKTLKEAGLLSAQRRGTWVWYRIAEGRQGAVTALLDAFAPAVVTRDAPAAGAPVQDGGEDLDDRITRLGEQIADEMPGLHRELVLSVVRESYAGLARSARITRYLVPQTERFARQRLADLTRDRETSVPQVLFVCVANAGRSQLAAAIVNQLAAGRVVARSAGSTPASDVHPHVRSLLTQIEGADRSATRFPKPLTDDAVRAADIVVTMGCGDVCPVIPGIRYEDWPVGDPALASPEGVEAIREEITTRVRALLDTLLTP